MACEYYKNCNSYDEHNSLCQGSGSSCRQYDDLLLEQEKRKNGHIIDSRKKSQSIDTMFDLNLKTFKKIRKLK